MTKDTYKLFEQYNTDILYHEYKYYSPDNINKSAMSLEELGIYRDKIHYIGLFYLHIYNKKDLIQKKKLFFDKYFQYFFYEKLKIVSHSVIDNIAKLI